LDFPLEGRNSGEPPGSTWGAGRHSRQRQSSKSQALAVLLGRGFTHRLHYHVELGTDDLFDIDDVGASCRS